MAKKKTTRRARGTGSIFKSRGVWVGRLPVGRKPDGTTLYREVRAATQAEVVRKLATLAPLGPEATVSELAERWLANHTCRPNSRTSYIYTTGLINRELGPVRARDLTIGRVERFASGLVTGGLSPATARKALADLKALLSAAVREGTLTTNPAKGARPPKKDRRTLEPYTPAELAAVIAGCRRPATYPIALLAATGCRIGEACALEVTDFDVTAGTVSITKTVDRSGGIGPPKSANGYRTLRVPAPALPALVAAVDGRAAGPLFATAAGERRSPRVVARAWAGLVKRLGVAYKRPHAIRHSVGTALVSSGVPLGDCAKFLGDSPSTLISTYLHPAGTDPADTLETLYSSKVAVR